MKITVARSGGFAGINQTRTISTDSLKPEQAQRLEAIARALPGQTNESKGADNFQYDITVDDGKNVRTHQYFGEVNPATELIDSAFGSSTEAHDDHNA